MRISNLCALLLAATMVQGASAATLLYDLGDSSQTTPGNYNNIIVNGTPETTLVLDIADSVDSTGASTGISISVDGFNPGSNQNGANPPSGDAAAIFDTQATRDNAFAYGLEWAGNAARPLATVSFAGLDGSGATTYDFTMFASRSGSGQVRDASYSFSGAVGGVGVLDAYGNLSEVVTVSGVVPSAAGEVVMSVTPGPNNNNDNQFYYLGAIQLVSNTVPEPTTLVMVGLAGLCGLARCR